MNNRKEEYKIMKMKKKQGKKYITKKRSDKNEIQQSLYSLMWYLPVPS